ncbi:hypothetical protein VYU27_000460 [Nannochloropsis oceanica]
MTREEVKMMAAAKPLSGRSLYILNGADKICYDAFYGTRKPAVMYLPCLFYPKVPAVRIKTGTWGGGEEEEKETKGGMGRRRKRNGADEVRKEGRKR